MSGLQSGIVEMKMDGAALFIEGEWEYDDGTPTKEDQVGHNYTAPVFKPAVRYVAGNARFETLAEESEFLAISNGTGMLRLANGEALSLEAAYVTRTGATKTESGLVPVRIVARINPNSRKGM